MRLRTLAWSMRSATRAIGTSPIVRVRPIADEMRNRTPMFSAGVPVILLHGVGGSEGYTDEIITFGLLGGLVVGLTLLAFRGARTKNKRRPRARRGRRR